MNPYNLELYTYLAPSKICSGVGVFALIDISRDTIIWKLRDEPYKVPWDLLTTEIRDHIKSMTWCDDEGFWIDCHLDRIYQAYYVNHSDNPNCNVIGEEELYIAIRNIKKNEELTYKYLETDIDWL
jgi:SET domain-containing protein